MSELRRDPVLGRWVIIAPDRLQRPNEYDTAPSDAGRLCPFCPGHEDLTPKEITAIRDSSGWSVRVVPNLFPALRVEDELEREGNGLFDRVTGVGAHEVVIETPRHDADLADLSPSEVEAVLWTWSERLRDLARDIRLRAAILFRNRGEAAGASLRHAHSQIIALPNVPGAMVAALDTARHHYVAKERCLICDIVAQEKRENARIILDNGHSLALAPWAPRTAFETWIVPGRHASRFEFEPRATIAGVAQTLRATLRKMAIALEKPAYNLMLHTAPFRHEEQPHSHWRLEIAPVLTRPAGFEWGTGSFINPVSPEEAAAFLRKTPG
jgi:UDPglucose--hexose-1-phosphate uridylyltransferase